MSDSNNSTFKPALLLMSGRAAAFTVTFLIPMFLSRIFSKAEFGTYKQIFLIVYTLYGIGQLGMAESLYYFLPSFPKNAGRFVSNALVVLGLTGLVFFGALILFEGHIATWLSNDNLPQYVWLAGAFLFLMLASCMLEIVMIARKHYKQATVTYAVSDLVRGAMFIIPAVLTESIEWLMIGGLAFCTVRVITLLAYLKKEFKGELGVDVSLLKQQFAYTVPYALAIFVEVIQQNYHQYVVSWKWDPATFAIYSVGCLQIPLVDFIASPASNVMMVRIGEELREGRRKSILAIWNDTNRKLALVFFPLIGLLVVNAYRIITLLFTSEFIASVPIFMVWSLTIAFAIFQTDGVLRALAQTRFLIVMNLARLAAIIGLMEWSLSRFQLVGPVIVTIVGVAVARFIALMRIRKLLEVSFANLMPWRNLGGIGIVSMLAAVPSAFVGAHLTMHSLVVLPLSGMVYVTAYAALLLGFGLLSEGEKRSIADLLARYTGLRLVRGN